MFTEITSILDNYLAENDFECTTRIELDFGYYCAESVIAYSLVATEQTDRLFMEFARNNGLKNDCGIFLLSFFHELGHDETYFLIDNRTTEKCEKAKAKLTTSAEDCKKYFNLTDEKMATLWAIDYINNNEEKIRKLAEKLQIAIDKL